MSKKRVLIVEDDKSTRDMLEKLINEIDVQTICYKVSNIEMAYRILHENIIDVFILDIILDTKKLGDVSGINLALEVRKMDRYTFTPIIFVTSLEDPKFYAYAQIHSFKYVEKPFRKDELKQTLKVALKYKTEYESDKTIFYRKDGILMSVKENDIIYMENKLRTAYVHTVNECVEIPYKTCKDMLNILNEKQFVQCNRNTIVNKKFVKYIDINSHIIGLFDTKRSLSVGTKYLKQVLCMLEIA